MIEMFGGGGAGTAEAPEHRVPGAEITQEELEALGIGKDNIEEIEVQEPKTKEGLLMKLREIARKPAAKVGIAAILMVSALGVKANAAETSADAAREFSKGKPPATAEVKMEMTEEEEQQARTMAVQERMGLVLSSGMLTRVDLGDWSISDTSVKVDGQVFLTPNDYSQLDDICKIDKGSILEKDQMTMETKINNAYADKTEAVKMIQMEKAKDAIEQKLATHMLLYSKLYFEVQKNPDNKEAQDQLAKVQKAIEREIVMIAAFNHILGGGK